MEPEKMLSIIHSRIIKTNLPYLLLLCTLSNTLSTRSNANRPGMSELAYPLFGVNKVKEIQRLPLQI